MFARKAPYVSFFVAAALTACGHGAVDTSQPTVAFVEAARGSGDEPFNALARDGLVACGRQTGARIAIAATSDAERQLTLFATENADTILGIGPQMAPAIAQLARRFGARHFAIIGATVAEPNVESMLFNREQGALLAGALAAMVSPHASVALLGDATTDPQRQIQAAFSAGATAVKPRAVVRATYLGPSDDRATAQRAASQLFASGSDVIYDAAGGAGLGAFQAVQGRRGAYLIGNGVDQDALAPGKVLASVLDRVDVAALRACLETVAQKPASGLVELGLAEGAVALTRFRFTRAVVGEARIHRLSAIAQAIAAGSFPKNARDGR